MGVTEKLVERVDNIECLFGLPYKMMKSKELVVHIDEVQVPTQCRKDHRGVESDSESVNEEKDIPPSSSFDPQGASTNGTA